MGNSNLISREALIEKVELLDWYSTNDKGVLHSGAADEESAYVRYADVEKVIGEVMAVEAEPVVHAHWRGDAPGDWHCSHCGEYAADGGFEQTKRCPHCGAHMDEEVADG